MTLLPELWAIVCEYAEPKMPSRLCNAAIETYQKQVTRFDLRDVQVWERVIFTRYEADVLMFLRKICPDVRLRRYAMHTTVCRQLLFAVRSVPAI